MMPLKAMFLVVQQEVSAHPCLPLVFCRWRGFQENRNSIQYR